MMPKVLTILIVATFAVTSALPTASTTTAPSTSTLAAPPLVAPPTQQPPAPPQPTAAAAASAASAVQPSPAPSQQFPNTYRFVHNNGRSMVSESRDGKGNVAGSFSFLGADGIQHTTYYRAGPQGYEMIGGPQISGLTLLASGRSAQGATSPPPASGVAVSPGDTAAPLEQPQGRSVAGDGSGATASVALPGNMLQEVASLQQLIDSPQFLLNRPSQEMYTNPELFYQQKFEQLQDSLYKTNEFNIPIPKPLNDSLTPSSVVSREADNSNANISAI